MIYKSRRSLGINMKIFKAFIAVLISMFIPKNTFADEIAAHNGEVRIISGVLSGQTLNTASSQITVTPGYNISGAVRIQTNNLMIPNAVAPLGYTWTWGNRKSSIIVVNNWIPTGKKTWSISFNQKAPSSPGIYYLLFGFQGEFNLQQVFSCTNWTWTNSHRNRTNNNPVKWNDENDYFDMTDDMLTAAQASGFVPSWKILFNDGYHLFDAPVASIKIIVKPNDIAVDIINVYQLKDTYYFEMGKGALAQGNNQTYSVTALSNYKIYTVCNTIKSGTSCNLTTQSGIPQNAQVLANLAAVHTDTKLPDRIDIGLWDGIPPPLPNATEQEKEQWVFRETDLYRQATPPPGSGLQQTEANSMDAGHQCRQTANAGDLNNNPFVQGLCALLGIFSALPSPIDAAEIQQQTSSNNIQYYNRK